MSLMLLRSSKVVFRSCLQVVAHRARRSNGLVSAQAMQSQIECTFTATLCSLECDNSMSQGTKVAVF